VHAQKHDRTTSDRPAQLASSAPAKAAAPVLEAVNPGQLTAQAVRSLQRSIGNAAVSRLVEQSRHQHGAGCGHVQQATSASQPLQRATEEQHRTPTAAQHPTDATPAVQRAGKTDIQFRDKTIKQGEVLFKGGNWPDGAALMEAAKTQTTRGEWGACYLGTPANVSVGYMEEGNQLLQITLTRDVKLLEIHGEGADDGSTSGDAKAAAIKQMRGYATDPFLMDSIRANGYDGAYMNSDSEGTGKEVILHWSVVSKVCHASVASKQPKWDRKMGVFNELSDDE